MKSTRRGLWILLWFHTFISRPETASTLSGDVILGGLATQSGTYNNYEAQFALDGNKTTYAIALSKPAAWWQVDLLHAYSVTYVEITGRVDSIDYKYLSNFTIAVGSTNATDESLAQECYYYNEEEIPISQYPYNAICYRPVIGRYVTIKRQGGYRVDALTLCEVEIHGFQIPEFSSTALIPPNTAAVAIEKTTVTNLPSGFELKVEVELTMKDLKFVDAYRNPNSSESLDLTANVCLGYKKIIEDHIPAIVSNCGTKCFVNFNDGTIAFTELAVFKSSTDGEFYEVLTRTIQEDLANSAGIIKSTIKANDLTFGSVPIQSDACQGDSTTQKPSNPKPSPVIAEILTTEKSVIKDTPTVPSATPGSTTVDVRLRISDLPYTAAYASKESTESIQLTNKVCLGFKNLMANLPTGSYKDCTNTGITQGSTVTNNQLTIDGVPDGVTSDQVTSGVKATIEKDLKAPDGFLKTALGSNNITLDQTTGTEAPTTNAGLTAEQQTTKATSGESATNLALSSSIYPSLRSEKVTNLAITSNQPATILELTSEKMTNSALISDKPATSIASIAEVSTNSALISDKPATSVASIADVPTNSALISDKPATSVASIAEVPTNSALISDKPATSVASIAEVPTNSALISDKPATSVASITEVSTNSALISDKPATNAQLTSAANEVTNLASTSELKPTIAAFTPDKVTKQLVSASDAPVSYSPSTQIPGGVLITDTTMANNAPVSNAPLTTKATLTTVAIVRIPTQNISIDVQIIIRDRDYLEDYGNLASSDSEQLRAKVCKGYENLMINFTEGTYKECKMKSIKKGSVVAESELTIGIDPTVTTPAQVAADLGRAIIVDLDNSNGAIKTSVNSQNITLSSITLSGQSPEQPTPPPAGQNNAIVGGAVTGGVAAVAITVVVVIAIVKARGRAGGSSGGSASGVKSSEAGVVSATPPRNSDSDGDDDEADDDIDDDEDGTDDDGDKFDDDDSGSQDGDTSPVASQYISNPSDQKGTANLVNPPLSAPRWAPRDNGFSRTALVMYNGNFIGVAGWRKNLGYGSNCSLDGWS